MSDLMLCPIPVQNGADCWRAPHPESKQHLCPEHWREIVEEWCAPATTFRTRCMVCGTVSFGRRADAASAVCENCGASIADRNAILEVRAREVEDERRRAVLRRNPTSVVYYLRFADRIKIGTSTNLRQRITTVYHDEVLAVEIGDAALETSRHRQFHHYLIRGQREWFRAGADLTMHINDLRKQNGEPLAAADRWAARAREELELIE